MHAASRPLRGRRRLLAYCVLGLVPVLAAGILITTLANSRIREQGLAQARAQGQLIDRFFLALDGPGQRVHLTPSQIEALRSEVKELAARREFYGVTVWSASNQVIFDASGPFTPRRLAGEQLRLVRRGEVVARVVTVPHGSKQVVEVSSPLEPKAPANGYFIVYLPYQMVQAELSSASRVIDTSLAIALALLYLMLFLINQSTSRGLRREAAMNAGLARTDPLTGLPNRRALHEDLDQRLSGRTVTGTDRTLGASGGEAALGSFAVVLMDLDEFKFVNDNLGHPIGDRLLVEVADRLRGCIREGDAVARLGGDEFSLVLSGTRDREQVGILIERVRAELKADVELAGIPLSLDGSFGVAMCPQDGTDSDVLLRRADTAMYRAKATETSVCFYDPDLDGSRPEWVSLAAELRHAVAGGKLRLEYQPEIDLVSGSLLGAEALLRWDHPEHGVVEDFLEVAERTGSIRLLTEWVLDEALHQLADWDHSLEVPRIAVNISTKSLRYEDGLPETVSSLLRKHAVSADRLTLEITETSLVADNTTAAEILGSLSALGVKISIDDFGKGFTGIAYLKDLPVQQLKIDKTFVMGMSGDRTDHAIVQSLVELSQRLGLECTAEGIESVEAYETLRTMGCPSGQGFWISLPLSPTAFGEWVRSRRAGGASGQSLSEQDHNVLLGR